MEYEDKVIEKKADRFAAELLLPDEALKAVSMRSRDNARSPFQWNDKENAGFTTGKPWLHVNPNYTEINVKEALEDKDSVFYYYQKLIALRKSLDVIRTGSFTLLCPEDEKIFAYTRDTDREHLLVVCNFSGEYLDFELPGRFDGSEMIINNYETSEPGLRPYEAAMLYYTT